MHVCLHPSQCIGARRHLHVGLVRDKVDVHAQQRKGKDEGEDQRAGTLRLVAARHCRRGSWGRVQLAKIRHFASSKLLGGAGDIGAPGYSGRK